MSDTRCFGIETNNLDCSIFKFLAYLQRQADVVDAWVEAGHRTLVVVVGPTTKRIGTLLQSRFRTGKGSALITRKRGRHVSVLLFNPRANKRWKRLM